MQVLSDRHATQIAHTEKFERQHEAWKALWLAVAGVIVITLTWNVLIVSFNGISY